jgi:hypothetical protein
MRLRTLLVLVLLPLCLAMTGRAPAAGAVPAPDRARPVPPKVYPVALRYRQQFYQQVALPAPPSPVQAWRPGAAPTPPPVERTSSLPSGALLLSLLVRLQP